MQQRISGHPLAKARAVDPVVPALGLRYRNVQEHATGGCPGNELIAFAESELAHAPCEPDLWRALGTSPSARGRSEESIIAFRRTLELAPGRVDACCGLALSLLRLGRFAEGFAFYEHRQKNGGNCRRYAVAPWRGEPLAGKHVAVSA